MLMQIRLVNSIGSAKSKHYALQRHLLRGQDLAILDRQRILYISVQVGFVPAPPVWFNETMGAGA